MKVTIGDMLRVTVKEPNHRRAGLDFARATRRIR